MRKFNIRKVLDGLSAVSAVASASSAAQQQQAGNRETEIQETLQSEHFQLCKVNECCSPEPAGGRGRGRAAAMGAAGFAPSYRPHRALPAAPVYLFGSIISGAKTGRKRWV